MKLTYNLRKYRPIKWVLKRIPEEKSTKSV